MLFLKGYVKIISMTEEQDKLPCAGKMVFDNEKEAEAAMLTVEWQHGNQLKVYRCQHCKLWHLSSK